MVAVPFLTPVIVIVFLSALAVAILLSLEVTVNGAVPPLTVTVAVLPGALLP